MAVMYPSEFRPAGNTGDAAEKQVFDCLERQLPDDYHVFHSVQFAMKSFEEHEIDFLVFHKDKGLLVIEVKAGAGISCVDGEWQYTNGRPMQHGGPFLQAYCNAHDLRASLEEKKGKEFVEKCKFMYAVWFPDMLRSQVDEVDFPTDAQKLLTLTLEDLGETAELSIARIMDNHLTVRIGRGRSAGEHLKIWTRLTEDEARQYLKTLITPTFHLIPLLAAENVRQEQRFAMLLKEQRLLLNYLQEQPMAVINGRAGTGKTILACEKAKLHAAKGEQVLFLMVNTLLMERLRKEYEEYPEIRFYTVDALSTKLLGWIDDRNERYEQLGTKLEGFCKGEPGLWELVMGNRLSAGKNRPWHVIIDEGQDFGSKNLPEAMDVLWLSAMDEDSPLRSFYVFYDQNQLIQGDNTIPDFIRESDCKLTLYRNCRNTNKISQTADAMLRLGLDHDQFCKDAAAGTMKKFRPTMLKPAALPGRTPMMYFERNPKRAKLAVDKLLATFRKRGDEDIVILTCKTIRTCAIRESLIPVDEKREVYMYHYGDDKIRVTTCRKFKGLEADAVILMDFGMETLTTEQHGQSNALLPYTGASRAKHDLGIISILDEAGCQEILAAYGIPAGKNPCMTLAEEDFFMTDYCRQ